MTPNRIVIAVIAMLSTLVATHGAFAATYKIRMFNGLDRTITRFDVKDAALRAAPVSGFKPLAPGTSQTITVTLPGKECQAYVKTRADNGFSAEGRAAFCIMDSGMAVIPDRQRGLAYIPWHQYRAMGYEPK